MSSKVPSPRSPNGVRSGRRPVLPPIKPPMSPPSRDGSENGLSASSHIEGLADHAMRERTSSIGTPESHRSLKLDLILNNNMEAPDDQESVASDDLSASRSTSNSSPISSDGGPTTPGRALHHVSSSSPSPNMAHARLKLPTTLGSIRSTQTTLGAPTGEINARKSPFLSNAISNAETRPSESMVGMHSNGATSPMMSRTIHPLSHSAVASIGGRRDSDSNSHFVPSQSNSPTTSYSSFGPPGRVTPPPPWSSSNQLPTQLPPISTQMPPHISIGGDSPYGTPTGSIHNGVQLMTYYTNKGPTQIPVDVQAASREADEKRKRNAGASARFRQRRKEKEREASHTIAKLEGEVRKIGEERDSYRVERDYYRSIVQKHVHPGVIPRAPSPRQRRSSSSRSTSDSPDWQQRGERGSDDGRNQRRRLSGYHDTATSGHASSASPSDYYAHHHERSKSGSMPGLPPLGPYNGTASAGYEGGWAHPRA